ncbi:hypothetical protein HanIR_Chr08g0367271 [Helianthus annuus]|nr:hypothetical protein HanIR_Chr08g0367271 [Helianthus annuus]
MRFVDYPSAVYGRGESAMGMGKKIFIGTLPQEASDPRRSGHRGFGFVTFAEDGVTDCISRRSHEICGQQVAKDTSTPIDDY